MTVQRKKPRTEINIELLPRSLHINSRKEERTVTHIKQKFRENMLHRGRHGYMFSTRGRVSKAYYHGLAKMPEFGEDEHGVERIQFDPDKVGFEHKNPVLEIIN